MLLRSINIVSKIVSCRILQVRHSALFINGLKASETYTYIIPWVDFQEYLKNIHLIQENLNKRKVSLNLNKLIELWAVYKELKFKRLEYDNKKREISNELGKLIKSDPNGEDTKKLRLQIELIKDNIRKLKLPLWSAEENAMLEALKIPNSVHNLTPNEDQNVIISFGLPPSNIKSYLQIGTDTDLITFKKNESYYLKGDAAIFELGAKFYFSGILKKNNYIQFSNPDFVKSVIVEGCGEDHTNPDATFILHHNESTKVSQDSRLHLTGGGSLSAFMAYHAKNVIYSKNYLPLKYFSMGRQYVPSPSNEDNLFHVSQSSVIQIFVAARDHGELDHLLEEVITILTDIYTQLGYHFRLGFVPAYKLLMWESLRMSVEMFSPSLNQYIEVGNVSVSGDYISKRLMYSYFDQKQIRFPHLLSGTILNIPKLLGCILEQDCDFSVPKQFQVENWSV